MTNVATNRQAGIEVVLEDIHDPHNAAAILRSCEAFGIQRVAFVFTQEAPYNPRRVGKTSSSSANKWLDLTIHDSIETYLQTIDRGSYRIIATTLQPGVEDLYQARLTDQQIVLIVGNEHRGLSKDALRIADTLVQIPMRGFVQSLNVSVSTALVLAEVTRQRSRNMERYMYSKDEAQALASYWIEHERGRNR